jgi:ABC-2 type transport system ATP-binding protein
MSESAVVCRDLVLDYGGGTVIGPLNFTLEKGTSVALVGPNGAGKTSLIHMLLGLRPPTSGQILIQGQEVPGAASREGMGYVPEVVEFPERSRATRILNLHSRMVGKPFANRREIEAYVETFGLELPRTALRVYSKGMKQRLALALALRDCSRFLILDEPHSGLDPVGMALLRSQIDSTKKSGTTLLLSTHRLAEIRHLADRMLVMAKGRIVADTALSQFPDEWALERFFMEKVT